MSKQTWTNEIVGITAEAAACFGFILENNLEEDRIYWPFVHKIMLVILKACEKNNLVLTKHQGKNNGKVDFIGEIDDPTSLDPNEKVKVSMKTLMGKDGKICPQGGQATYTTFHTVYHRECPIPDPKFSRFEANTFRWNWIKKHIGEFLNKMQDWTFCCDYLLLIENCKNEPRARFLENKNIDFTKLNIEYKHPEYFEKDHRTISGEKSEFSTNVYYIDKGEQINIGEFQFHHEKKRKKGEKKKGRNVIKFRFYKKFYV